MTGTSSTRGGSSETRGARREPGGRRPRQRGLKGRGSVYLRADGRWEGRLVVGTKPDPRRPGRLVPDRRTVYGASEEQAWSRLDDLRRQANGGQLALAAAARDTVAALLARWLAGKRGTVAPASWQRYEECVRLRLVPALGHLRPAAMRPDHLRTLYSALQGRVAPRTVRYTHVTVHQALAQAVEDGELARNVAAAVRPPKLEQPEQRALTPDEVRRLCAAAAGERLGGLWVVAVYTGARQGELLGLRWGDVDLAAATLTIRRTVARDDRRRPALADPKTAASVRRIVLPRPAAAALVRHRALQDAERERAGPAWQANELVFCSELGTLLDASNVVKRPFRRVAERAGLPPETHPHTLRHTAATAMLVSGTPLPEVARILGHASPQVTATVYAHVLPGGGELAARRLERLLGASLPEPAAGRARPGRAAEGTVWHGLDAVRADKPSDKPSTRRAAGPRGRLVRPI